MFDKIQINKYIFNLNINEEDETVTTCSFQIQGQLPAQLTEDQLKYGSEVQQAIFKGMFDWIIFRPDKFRIEEFGLDVSLGRPIYDNGSLRYDTASFYWEQKMVCEHCKDPRCDFDCILANKWIKIKDAMSYESKEEELESNRNFNYALDGIESMMLSHIIAGLNIESDAYKEGIRTALDGCGNNI